MSNPGTNVSGSHDKLLWTLDEANGRFQSVGCLGKVLLHEGSTGNVILKNLDVTNTKQTFTLTKTN
jgi:hypothetical protein